jgi:tetratricopeptide (TPR) repeat protein
MVRAADFHLQLGRYEDALDLAGRALDIRFDLEAERIVGLIYLHRGQHKKAVLALTRAERTPDVYEGLIRGHLALGQLREAVAQAAASRTIKKPPESLRRACALALVLEQRRETLFKELRVPPNKSAAWAKAADAFLCAEHAYETGIRDPGTGIKRAAMLLPLAFEEGVEIGRAYSLRGLLFLEKGQLAKAMANAEKGIRLSPRDARAYHVRGRVRLERAAAGAVTDLTRAAELSERKDAQILHSLAAALALVNRRAEALATEREAVKLRPKDPEFLAQLRELEKTGG